MNKSYGIFKYIDDMLIMYKKIMLIKCFVYITNILSLSAGQWDPATQSTVGQESRVFHSVDVFAVTGLIDGS